MKKDGITPWCVGIESGDATGWPLTDWMEDVMLRLHGPDVYDKWVNHQIPFNDPQVKDVAQMVADIWFTDGNVLGGRESIASTGLRQRRPAHPRRQVRHAPPGQLLRRQLHPGQGRHDVRRRTAT